MEGTEVNAARGKVNMTSKAATVGMPTLHALIHFVRTGS